MVRAGSKEKEETPVHGHVLERILSHVSLVDLVPASHVSKAWMRAVFSSLRHFNAPKPWVIVHAQGSRTPNRVTARAYDPRSDVWFEVQPPAIEHVSAVRSSSSNILYALSPATLSFSVDPLRLTWHQADAPAVWRADPIVAAVGGRIVVAGGTCDFEDNPLAVEIYDVASRTWSSCESMPAVLKDSSASTWLSAASDDRKLYVTEKHSGTTLALDPETKTWSGPYNLRPDPSIFYSVISFSNNRLILIALIGDASNAKGLKLWGVNCESFECEGEIGEMPMELLEKLKGESLQLSSIGVCFSGKFVYIFNPSWAEEVIGCEFDKGGCRWWSIRNRNGNGTERLVLTCSEVGIEDVRVALRSKNSRIKALQ
ncbi:F-box/kelch-repeat protein At1g23390 [Diospyros lotus]|uniref:F-box/kelch-repeat protein At1g23390 n=1 Tax=Diospyros lotus TaxID=55363 RepID=UPI0022532BCA|nr:F-box/kelch-repeat protein At1g23390 [Diospyros lotus]